MADSRIHELKRAWEASRSLEAQVAYLREGVRVGVLPRDRLELAAYCGHLAAIGACDLTPGDANDFETSAWARGLIDRDPRSFVQLLLHLAGGDSPALEAARTWAESPCPSSAEAAGLEASKAALSGDVNGELVAGAAYVLGQAIEAATATAAYAFDVLASWRGTTVRHAVADFRVRLGQGLLEVE